MHVSSSSKRRVSVSILTLGSLPIRWPKGGRLRTQKVSNRSLREKEGACQACCQGFDVVTRGQKAPESLKSGKLPYLGMGSAARTCRDALCYSVVGGLGRVHVSVPIGA
jgi:hypothetical protein